MHETHKYTVGVKYSFFFNFVIYFTVPTVTQN